MENEKVPYIVFESQMARNERHIKRLWIVLIVSIVLIFVSNAAWLLYISQYDFESYDYSQDGEGINIIGDKNGVSYNVAEDESSEKNT